MDKTIEKSDWFFGAICLALGIMAEESFFRGGIGISNIIFILVFYTVFFLRFRHFPFSNQRLSYLMMICIWLLSASFFVWNNFFFYALNILVVPVLVILHLLIVTGPKRIEWASPKFIVYAYSRIVDAIKYNFSFTVAGMNLLKGGIKEDKYLVWKKVLIGIVISIPVLFVVLTLLMSADTYFKQLIGGFPEWMNHIRIDDIFRIIVVMIYTFVFFGFLQILYKKIVPISQHDQAKQTIQMDGIIALTVLVLLNIVYLLFTIVQFKYFFSGSLKGDLTYAENARRGFFELLFVTLINLSVAYIVLHFVKYSLKRLTQFLLTLLLLLSGVMLYSAFLRLLMYEDAYGFSFIRVLVHSFMIFLALIFAFTLMKVWLEKLSLFHFYFITALIYYTILNVIDLDRVVVKQNIIRYEQSGKIDLQYLNNLSYSGVSGLIELYQKKPDLKGLKEILQARKKEAITETRSWQSFNLERQEVNKKLEKLSL